MNDLLSVQRDSGDLFLRGNMTIGGTNTTGARTAKIWSSDSSATVKVEANQTGTASAVLSAKMAVLVRNPSLRTPTIGSVSGS